MKISTQLTRGLDEAETKSLVGELQHSLLARQLKRVLQAEIERLYKTDEQIDTEGTNSYLKAVGERRGYRHVLNMILEE